MGNKRTRKQEQGQSNSEHRSSFQEKMISVGFVPGTQVAYLRAFDRFEAKLDRKTAATASVRDARRYLSRLKQSGVSDTVYSHAAAALRFFFEEVRGIEWKPISPLQKRMVEDMCLRGFSNRTQDSYVRSVTGLAQHYMRSPEVLSDEEIRSYFVHLTCERKLARPTVTIALCGIKFLYVHTLRRDWSVTGVPVPKREKFLPVILSREEVYTILSKIRIVRHAACLGLIYACGLRLGEGCRVRITDIDRDRGMLHVRGKGSKDRYVPLPPSIMPLLGKCWLSHRNDTWLFPWVGRGREGGRARGQFSDRHVPKASVQQVFRKAYKETGISKKVSVHSLRHAYATHLLEAGVSLRQIQVWLGHSSPTMTAHYARLTKQSTDAAGKILADLMGDISNLGK